MIELTSMEKVYDHTKVEGPLYKEWEERGYFKPEVNPDGTPYTIILPPPNANGALHFGHAMFTVEDILARYHRMKGDAALWFPGSDHAGIETQFVFEKKLKDQGKSRLDFKQEELFQMISDYVDENRGGIEGQLRRLGFSLDWSREKYTLDADVVKLVHKTFKKMYDEGLIYRGHKLVNYCTFDGTSFSDLEVVYEERVDSLYYVKYGPLVLATTRPETTTTPDAITTTKTTTTTTEVTNTVQETTTTEATTTPQATTTTSQPTTTPQATTTTPKATTTAYSGIF
jgi:valyl-tRNA synthetase